VITVALPSVARALGVSNPSTAIVLSAYFAAYAIVLLPGGALVDRFGARRLSLIGLGVFAVGAGAGALMSSIGALVATRIVQGIGAGLAASARRAAGPLARPITELRCETIDDSEMLRMVLANHERDPSGAQR
jgi:MFS family permease